MVERSRVMSKQQTALNWFVNQRPPRALEDVYDLLQQALEMEKQQIINSHLTGLIHPLEMEATKQAEQYYNETYGNES